MKNPILTKDVEKALDLSTKSVHDLARKGVLHTERTPGGTRLYDAEQVQKVAKDRAAAKKKGR